MSAENTTTAITSTEFRAHSGQYIEQAGKRPVYITKHGRPVRVLIDIEEYERLRAQDVKHYRPDRDELPADILAELDIGYQGEPTPHLDHLME